MELDRDKKSIQRIIDITFDIIVRGNFELASLMVKYCYNFIEEKKDILEDYYNKIKVENKIND